MHRTRLARWHMWIACRNHKLLKHFGWVSLSSQYTSLAHPVESETRICVPSSAPIFENVEVVEEEPSSTSRWLAGHPTAMMIGSAGAQGRRSEEEMLEEEAPWLGDDGKKRRCWEMTEKKEGERHYKRLGILWLIDCDNYSLFLVIVPLLWQYGCCHKRLVVKPLLWLTEPVVTNLSDNCTFVTIIVTKVFVIY